jgi:hypothetical protein
MPSGKDVEDTEMGNDKSASMYIREFVPSRDAIQAEAAIDISALQEYIANVYRDVRKWGRYISGNARLCTCYQVRKELERD